MIILLKTLIILVYQILLSHPRMLLTLKVSSHKFPICCEFIPIGLLFNTIKLSPYFPLGLFCSKWYNQISKDTYWDNSHDHINSILGLWRRDICSEIYCFISIIPVRYIVWFIRSIISIIHYIRNFPNLVCDCSRWIVIPSHNRHKHSLVKGLISIIYSCCELIYLYLIVSCLDWWTVIDINIWVIIVLDSKVNVVLHWRKIKCCCISWKEIITNCRAIKVSILNLA